MRRVYGNLRHFRLGGHGFRLCPTRPGKNAADMLLCVEAMAFVLAGLPPWSSPRGPRFQLSAEHLREAGRVSSAWAPTAPASFRTACSSS